MNALRKAFFAFIFAISSLPAMAQVPLTDTAARIRELVAAGSTADAVVVAATGLKELAADTDALGADATATLADAVSELAYRLAGERNYRDALVLMEQVVTLRRRALDEEDPALGRALNDAGVLLTTLGRYSEAEKSFESALAIREKVAGGEADVAQTLNNLAQAKKRLGKDREVEPLLRRTAALQEAALGPDAAALADTLADIADFLAANGRAEEALPLALRAFDITEKALPPEDPELARRLIKLANVSEALGRFQEAEAFFRRALVIRERAFGAESQQVAGVLSNLADTLLADKRPAEAEPLLLRALELQVKLRGAGHPSVGTTLLRLANSQRDQRRFAEAEQNYLKALAVLKAAFGADHPFVAGALEDFAELRFRQASFDDALDLFRQAGAIITRREAVSDPVRPDGGVLSRKQGRVFRWIAETGFEVADRQEAKRQALGTEAFLAIQQSTRSRTGVSLEQVATRVGLADPALAETVRQREALAKEWKAAENALIQALGGSRADRKPGDPVLSVEEQTARMAEIERRIGEIDAGIARDFPEFSELFNPKPLSIPETQALLGPDEALVTFSITDEDTLVWVVTKERLVWVHSPVGEAELADLVARARKGLDDLTADFDLAAAHELHAAILGPDRVAAAIEGKKHLIVVPTGVMTSLPFQLLVTETPPEAADADRFAKTAWLIRRHAVSVLPSISSFRLLKKAGSGSAPLPFIGLGDPVFQPGEQEEAAGGQRSVRAVNAYYTGRFPDLALLSRGLTRLAETADELRIISRTLGAAPDSVILRDRASESTLKALSAVGALANYRIVYFATHGLVAGEVEQLLNFRAEPALALTVPEVASVTDDGLLTATEAADLKLNADWVILSACNTAAGDKPGAEALSGLARSFFYAGARALLVSHWAVNSEAAVRLTTGTFERLATGEGGITRAEALRQTMLAIVDGADPDEAHPRYWAPFSIVGYGGL